MREKFWHLASKIVFEYNYFHEYQNHLLKIRWRVAAATGVIALSALALTQLMGNLSIVWQLLMLASGCIGLVYEKSAVADKLAALRYFLPDMGRQVNELAMDWLEVQEARDDCEDGIARVFYEKHLKERSELSDKYIGSLHFPEHCKSAERAHELAERWAKCNG